MQKQNECDHYVVHSNNEIITISELSDHIKRRMRIRYNARERVKQYEFMQFLDGRCGLMVKFNFCHNCGEKIDWEKIKEMVKDEN